MPLFKDTYDDGGGGSGGGWTFNEHIIKYYIFYT